MIIIITSELLSVILASVSQCCTFQMSKLCIPTKVCLMQLLISLSGNDHFFDCGHLTYTTLTCRQILPREASEYVSGALAYSAIVSVCSAANSTDCELKRKFLNTNGSIDISHPLLLFPCRTVTINYSCHMMLNFSTPQMYF